MTPRLEATDLCRHFGGLKAVDGVSLTLEPGTVLGLIGPNGAGKSTLLNLMSGCERLTAGRLVVDGRDLTGARPWAFARAGVARTFQVGKPFRHLTVAENVTTGVLYGAEPVRNRAAARARCDAVLERVGLDGQAGARVAELPVAAVRRLELARALAQQPRLLFLDELLAGLRSADIAAVLDLLRSVRDEGMAVVFVEHVVRAVFAVSDSVLVLDQGRVLARGTPEEIAVDERVIGAYLGRRHAERRQAEGQAQRQVERQTPDGTPQC
ncbi:MAG: ABC transporter ATP-binding protein [Actinobacteria bacterium]|nr:ABC transporter ATP-binding protein [Actinomycetota bacterium]